MHLFLVYFTTDQNLEGSGGMLPQKKYFFLLEIVSGAFSDIFKKNLK